MDNYDIAIVGAGPAGSTLARLIGSVGGKVLLIDGASVGKCKPCGGLLAPDAQKALASFDLTLPKDILVDPQIFSVKTIDLEKDLVRYYSRFYLNMDREKFDRWLISLVPESVELLRARCTAIEPAEGGYILSLRREDSIFQVKSRLVVGADGANSIVRRSFFPSKIMYYVSIQQWFAALDDSNPFYSCIFDPVTSESCSWSIHKDGYFIYGGSFLPRNCRQMFEKQKERIEGKYGFRFGEALKTEACKVYRPKRMADFKTGKDGLFLIGEAAGFISPSSFEGISSAILSAKALAESICEGGSIHASYRRKTAKLRLKMLIKCIKRLFMYVPFLRHLVMKLGLLSIKLDSQ